MGAQDHFWREIVNVTEIPVSDVREGEEAPMRGSAAWMELLGDAKTVYAINLGRTLLPPSGNLKSII